MGKLGRKLRKLETQQPAHPVATRCAKYSQVTGLQVFGIQGFPDLCPLDLRSGTQEVHPFRLREPTEFGLPIKSSNAVVTSQPLYGNCARRGSTVPATSTSLLGHDSFQQDPDFNLNAIEAITESLSPIWFNMA